MSAPDSATQMWRPHNEPTSMPATPRTPPARWKQNATAEWGKWLDHLREDADKGRVPLSASSNSEGDETGRYMNVEGTFEIELEGQPRHRRLRIAGELDLAGAQDLIQALQRACEEGARSVILDLHEVGYMDSSGIYALLSGRKICEESGCGYAIARGLSGPAEKTLEVTGLLDKLPFC